MHKLRCGGREQMQQTPVLGSSPNTPRPYSIFGTVTIPRQRWFERQTVSASCQRTPKRLTRKCLGRYRAHKRIDFYGPLRRHPLRHRLGTICGKRLSPRVEIWILLLTVVVSQPSQPASHRDQNPPPEGTVRLGRSVESVLA